ncbi:MAG: hypothetical protein LBL33_02045 [Tannerella sp.]|jgi:hypothetical protein|nr:hypothetical protein [Tannerella sp.]
MTQEDIRGLPGLGGDPMTSPLYDTDVWSAYANEAGRIQFPDRFIESSLERIPRAMQMGGRVAVNLNTGNTGHSVVMQSVVQKTITKVNGTVVQKLFYYAMNPGNGGSIIRITGRSIVRSYNVFYIF